jgi:hypothetical protein
MKNSHQTMSCYPQTVSAEKLTMSEHSRTVSAEKPTMSEYSRTVSAEKLTMSEYSRTVSVRNPTVSDFSILLSGRKIYYREGKLININNGLVNEKEVTDIIAIESERINAQFANEMYEQAFGDRYYPISSNCSISFGSNGVS